MTVGKLILFSGKMGAGKSTRARQVSQERNAVLISQDEWLAKLYPEQVTSFDDYLHCSSLLRPLVRSLVLEILKTGTSVVMDFPANTVNQRRWFMGMITEANAPNELIYLSVSNEVCLRQIERRRSEQPERAMYDTESMFTEVTKYFQEPEQSEGFNLHVVERNG